mgnify:CR=1 FL=1
MSRTANQKPNVATLSWWIGAVVSVSMVLFGAPSPNLQHLFPDTPYDTTGSGHAEQWRFLRAASVVIPAGSSFTIQAAETDTEMSLYMMAVGLLPRATAIPKTYYGRPIKASESARFLCVFGAELGEIDEPGRAMPVIGGIVVDRGSHQ